MLPREELVPGDVMLLRPGHDVPADGRLIGVDGLHADESALTGESLRTRAAVDAMIRLEGMTEAAELYLAGADPRHPCASPLYADLRGLPPLLIHVGDAEVILSDSTRIAARASEAGVAVSLEIWDEMPHVFPSFAGLLPEADQAIEQTGAWLDQRYPAARSLAGD